jgi:hypothetical protein
MWRNQSTLMSSRDRSSRESPLEHPSTTTSKNTLTHPTCREPRHSILARDLRTVGLLRVSTRETRPSQWLRLLTCTRTTRWGWTRCRLTRTVRGSWWTIQAQKVCSATWTPYGRRVNSRSPHSRTHSSMVMERLAQFQAPMRDPEWIKIDSEAKEWAMTHHRLTRIDHTLLSARRIPFSMTRRTL